MSARGVLRIAQGHRLVFWCPGCKSTHAVDAGWYFNGNYARPTFSPSILVNSGHYAPGHTGDCWCTWNRDHPEDPVSFKCERCHSFVTDGEIRFLTDCTHPLAGQIVPLEPF